MMHFTADILTKFDKDWALLAAGTMDDHNAMTVSWGGMGTFWGKPVVTVYIRPSRYTYRYMEENDFFTLSFYTEEYRRALVVMGSKSGRDCDKDQVAGLTAIKVGESVSYREAQVMLVCRRLYRSDLTQGNIPGEIMAQFYDGEPIHRMYIGEVVAVLERGEEQSRKA